MAKNIKNITPHYEMLYIISNQYTEEEIKPIVEKVKEIIKGNSGEVIYEEVWGKKKFAYPIMHFNHGYYFLVEFNLPSDKLAVLNNTLKMSSEVLRYQIVSQVARSAAEIKAEKEKQIAKADKEVKKKKEEMVKEELRVTTSPERPRKKVDLKDLDEKLDKILDTDDLL